MPTEKMPETRYTPASYTPKIEARAKEDHEPAKIVGYGAVYYAADDPGTEYKIWDDFVERIMPGCFDRAVREDDPRSFFNHDENIILGRKSAGTLNLAVDDVGLRYEITPPDTEAGRGVVEAVRRRDVTGSSFMFMPRDVSWREIEGLVIRELRDVELWEVGPVVFPAYPSTTSELRSRLVAEARKHGITLDATPRTVNVRRRLLQLRARTMNL